ncbi:MAG: aminofutalosine synthase MqnE [Myxococcota bacterium]
MNARAELGPLLMASLVQADLQDIGERVLSGTRLTMEDGRRLFETPHVAAVGALANWMREQRHGHLTYFNRNQHINATNVCEASCMFCSFARLKTGDPGAYTMSLEQALSRLRALRSTFVTEVHIVNGLNPDLPFSYYTDLLRALKNERPDLHIKGFTAVEIHYYAEKYDMTYEQVLLAFRDAGLDSLPGGGAEIFAERVRRKICHDKVDAPGWLEVHRTAHRLGFRTNATMLFGMVETLEERLDHMIQLRDLQDETGGFQTFIPLKFHNEHNRLNGLYEATGVEVLRTFAVSRLMLDNFAHIKAYWPMLGVQVAQASLAWGVDDLDGTVREERIYHMAGAKTPQALSKHDLETLIRDAGRKPVERDTLYHVAAAGMGA